MIKIALADDYLAVKKIWTTLLSANTVFKIVGQCSNGLEAIEAASTYHPHVFLMDLNMQPVNGIEATEIITKLFPAIKIIGMSIHADAVYVKRMLQAGANGYLTKSCSYEEIVEAIMLVNSGGFYICNEIKNNQAGFLN